MGELQETCASVGAPSTSKASATGPAIPSLALELQYCLKEKKQKKKKI